MTLNRPAIVERARIGELMRATYGYRGGLSSEFALKLLALTFVRPGELRAVTTLISTAPIRSRAGPGDPSHENGRPHHRDLSTGTPASHFLQFSTAPSMRCRPTDVMTQGRLTQGGL